MKETDDEIVPVKDVNPIGYIAGGNLDFNKRPRPRPPKKAVKSIWVAYLLWLVGGWWALHLLYLRRDRQAFIWLTTLGGFFGVGVIRDFFRIPSYVKDINEDNQYIAELIAKMRTYRKPPFSLVRFVGQILVGNYWSTLLVAAVPTEEIFGMKWTILTYLAPIGEALAVWTIGNIGHEQGELKWAMIGAIVVVPFSVFYPPVSNWSSIISAVLFEWKGKKWQRTPSKIPPCKRLMTFSGCLLIISSVWLSALYFNASVTDENGETIKLRDAVKNFLNSPMFLQFKENIKLFINNAMENGWGNAWRVLIEALDPHGIKHSLKVLGLQKNATKEEIKLTFKKLAKEWHPDRHVEDKEAANERFIEIREAYEKLSAYVNRRSHRNKQ